LGARAIGLVAGLICSWAVSLKFKLGFDDSLDVVGVHLVGGVIGTLMVGFLAVGGDAGLAQFGKQATGAFSVMGYSFAVSWIIAKLIHVTIGMRASEDEETSGLDRAYHAETAYDFSAVGGSHSGAGVGALASGAGTGSGRGTASGAASQPESSSAASASSVPSVRDDAAESGPLTEKKVDA
jgi:Amt family ammonium transporter